MKQYTPLVGATLDTIKLLGVCAAIAGAVYGASHCEAFAWLLITAIGVGVIALIWTIQYNERNYKSDGEWER